MDDEDAGYIMGAHAALNSAMGALIGPLFWDIAKELNGEVTDCTVQSDVRSGS